MTPPNLHLLPISNEVKISEVEPLSAKGQILACDFYIKRAETFTERPWGYQVGRVTNIDHHAPTKCMARIVSSANLAISWAKENGRASADDCVVINHTDCDSILSSAIVLGDLEPLCVYGEAALAADHTGAPNAIADLLQSLDAERDYALSLRNLRRLQEGSPLEQQAQSALDVRLRKRDTATRLIYSGRFTNIGSLAFAELDEAVDGEFFPALLPNATAIVIASPRPHEPGRWNLKVRLGHAAPQGLTLHDLQLSHLDANFGGRWNADSNKRGGGTLLSPEAYAKAIADWLQSWMLKPK